MNNIEAPLEINSINGNYFATFHSNLISLTQSIKNIEDCYVLIDSEISRIYKELLTIFPPDRYFIVEANEKNKSLQKVGEIAEWMMSLGATKTSHLVGIGGGVIQDLATFTSHIYYRGIKWVYVPTTLLSQGDSCIGAKCALNLNGHKNQLGVVHTPAAVEIFTGFLNSLPFAEIQSGFGEIAKLAVTGEHQFFDKFNNYLETKKFTTDGISEIIRASLAAKKFVVDQDEYESDLRRILNYGHSFGHALESLTKNEIVHGDAVVVGMDLINFVGLKIGITEPLFYEAMRSLFTKFYSHIKVQKNIKAEEWVNELRHDKKMQYGNINFAIPVTVGDLRIINMKLDAALISIVGEYIEWSEFFYSA